MRQAAPMTVRTEPPPVRRPVSAPLVAGALLVAGCAVVGLVDPRGGPTICPFKFVTGLDCPGCGGTRAAHHLVRGDLIGALDHNVLAVVAVPLILWALFAWLTSALGGPKLRTFSPSTRWAVAGAVALAVFWVVRNLSFAPFAWLYSGT